jgi:hypothetical protein
MPASGSNARAVDAIPQESERQRPITSTFIGINSDLGITSTIPRLADLPPRNRERTVFVRFSDSSGGNDIVWLIVSLERGRPHLHVLIAAPRLWREMDISSLARGCSKLWKKMCCDSVTEFPATL